MGRGSHLQLTRPLVSRRQDRTPRGTSARPDPSTGPATSSARPADRPSGLTCRSHTPPAPPTPAPARRAGGLQEARQIAARAELRDLQLDLTHARPRLRRRTRGHALLASKPPVSKRFGCGGADADVPTNARTLRCPARGSRADAGSVLSPATREARQMSRTPAGRTSVSPSSRPSIATSSLELRRHFGKLMVEARVTLETRPERQSRCSAH